LTGSVELAGSVGLLVGSVQLAGSVELASSVGLLTGNVCLTLTGSVELASSVGLLTGSVRLTLASSVELAVVRLDLGVYLVVHVVVVVSAVNKLVVSIKTETIVGI